ncbi:S-adenosyl-L-methionine-dependent methyltransferase, partial [Schizophyllum commune]
ESDPALAFVLENSAKHGLMQIAVSVPQGKYSGLRAAGNYLEVGTLGGCSTIWMARGLPSDGKLVTFELDEKTAGVAKENIAHAGLADRVEVVVVGPAEKSFAAMEEGTYDFAFIDAFVVDNVTHFVNNVTYMKECKRLVKSGGVINGLVDNIVQNGLVADEAKTAALKAAGEETSYIEAGRERLLEYLQGDQHTNPPPPPTDPDLEATTDSRGFDGWHFVLRK